MNSLPLEEAMTWWNALLHHSGKTDNQSNPKRL
jgi:hypothetical protein